MRYPRTILIYLIFGFLTFPLFSQESIQTKLVLLGTGNPNPDPNHYGPSVAVVVGDQAYLIDAGVGLVRRAASLSPAYGGTISALGAKRLNLAFITHLHSDHTIGLPDLILTPWVMGRNKPLSIIGPEGIKKMTDHLLEAYQEDIRYRLYGLEPANNQGWRVDAQEITEEGIVYEDSLVRVEAFNVKHGSWPQCFGFRFTTPDLTIVISGDTQPSDNLTKWAQGADILVHEVYSQSGWEQKTDFWKNYHRENHTSSLELGEIAKKINPSLVVLYHTLYWGSSDQDLLDEIQSVYPGKVLVGHDAQVINLN